MQIFGQLFSKKMIYSFSNYFPTIFQLCKMSRALAGTYLFFNKALQDLNLSIFLP